MPPCATCTPPRRCPALVWRLSRLTPLTTILCLSGMVRSTSPCLPLSLPAMTMTGSPGARSSQRVLGCGLFLSMCCLKDLRGERDDLHEVALAQLAGDGPEDASPSRVVRLREQHGRVLVEADERAVRALVLLVDPDHDGLHHFALLDLTTRLGGLDRGGDDVPHVGVLAVVAAGHADDQELLRPRVVRDLQARFLLDHLLNRPNLSRREIAVLGCGFRGEVAIAPGGTVHPGRLLRGQGETAELGNLDTELHDRRNRHAISPSRRFPECASASPWTSGASRRCGPG